MTKQATDNTPTEEQPHAEWPGTVRSRDELDSALEAGIRSGRSPRTHDEITARVRRELGIDG